MDRCFSDNATEKGKCKLDLVHGVPIVVINYCLTFIGTFGNFLIIFAVLNTPKLRHKISNFLLVSLAAADLFVTMFAQPLNATAVAFTTFRHCCIPELDFAYDFAGNFSVFNSLFHLACISIDRALVVRKPHQHHDIMSRYGLKIMLCICWGTATGFAIIRVNSSKTLMGSIGLVVFNFLIIICSYAVIVYEIKRERLSTSQDPAATGSISSRDARMEKRVAGTIAIIIFFFSICWFPLLGFYISVGDGFLRDLGGPVYMWIRTLVLSNSSMNFIVYSSRIEHFRVAYMRMINKILRRPREALGLPGKFNTASHGPVSNASKDNDIMELTTPSGVYNKKDKESPNKSTIDDTGETNKGREIDSAKESEGSVCEEKPQKEGGGDESQVTPLPVQVHFDDSDLSVSGDSENPEQEIPTVTPKVTFNGEPETLTYDEKPKTKSLSKNSKKFKLGKK